MPGSLKLDEGLRYNPSQTNQVQVDRAFAMLKARLQADPTLKIGLIYSANNNQAEKIHGAIRSGSRIESGFFDGTGQSHFYRELAKLINADPQVKDRIRVLPIATSMIGGDNMKAGNAVGSRHLNRDLKQIQDHIDQGYQVLATPSNDPKRPYAIGGSNSKGFYLPGFEPIQGDSQGAYVTKQLKRLEQGLPLVLDTSATPPKKNPATYLADLGPDLKKVVEAYKSEFNKEPGMNSNGITLEFKDMKSAVDFLKGQADKNLAFDMICKETDHRIFSDGSGKMVQGTNQEVEDYKKNADKFMVHTNGELIRITDNSAAPNTVSAAPNTVSTSVPLAPPSLTSTANPVLAPLSSPTESDGDPLGVNPHLNSPSS